MPLACGRRGVVDLEEELEQLAVRRSLRIEDDLNRLGMRAVIAIGRVRHVAAGIADTGRNDARHLTDQVLHAPEAAACQYCAFGGRSEEHTSELQSLMRISYAVFC